MLDRARPHGQVFGMGGGIAWEQGGQLFDSQGYPVDGNGERIRPPEPVSPAGPDVAMNDGLEMAHHKTLQAMVSQYGEPYTSKEAAIAFLRGKSA